MREIVPWSDTLPAVFWVAGWGHVNMCQYWLAIRATQNALGRLVHNKSIVLHYP
jgi:hypothetical protein